MKKKIISVLLIMSVIIAILLGSIISYAEKNNASLTLKLEKTYSNGLGYGVGLPDVAGNGKYIYNIVSYADDGTTEQRDLYCVKAEYGATWENPETATNSVTYELKYDLQTEREYLLNNLITDSDTEGVVAALLTQGGGQYEQLLWLFDNMYIAGDNVDEYLEKAGIMKDTDENMYYYHNEETGYDEWFGSADASPLTEEDIIAVQKVAIWKFTNGGVYDKTAADDADWLSIITSEMEQYAYLAGTSDSRGAMAVYLYKYLVNGANNGAGDYTTNPLGTNQVTINTTGLATDENDNYILQTKIVNGKYITGPIIVNDLNDMPYEIELLVTNTNGEVDFDYTDSNGVVIENATIESLVNRENGFYISTSANVIDDLNISITVSQDKTTKTLWLDGTVDEETGKITLGAEQPIVEIERTEDVQTTSFTVKPFDLALRKYITRVNGKELDGTDTRVPNFETNLVTVLQTGTTADYKHRKDPLEVNDGDVVTYSITIYNEGSKAGYATKIIDQLPEGLIMYNDTYNTNGYTVTAVDSEGNQGNTYTIDWDQLTSLTPQNRITLTIADANSAVSLDPYADGILDYETIEIECKVVPKLGSTEDIILTNVAWIEEAYDAEAKTVVSTSGTMDRDSQPQTSPSVNKDIDTTINYIGNESNKEDLTDSSYHYAGEQDDDDFEKIVIRKSFDLALFKHIAAISKDQTIEEGEYVTDTGKIDGTYLRAPVVKSIDSTTGKITYEQDDKAALTVEPGDYVLYTIRVYNEGEINGYASKIKDTLPIGLEFVVDNEEYNGIWTLEPILDNEGRQVVTTTWYAKGQGAELDSVEGDDNYTANLLNALNKEAAVSTTEPANPDYIDAQILCRVVEQATSNRVLVNYAQISDDTDENGKPIDDIDSTTDEWIDGEDDQDIERIQLEYFDLSLRKFITAVNGIELKNGEGKYERAPVVNVTPLQNGETTAIYTHSKQPLAVQVGDKIVYTLRVYNEGDINGYASEVTDYLPPYLTYVENSEINKKYGWKLSEDGRIVTTTYLTDTELEAFNGTELDYADLKIECIVADKAPLKQNQTNIAEISEYKYNGNTVLKDIDSTADNMISKDYLPTDEELPAYKDEEINKSYIPGNEDDDDFEKIYVKEFDLALRKFITKVQDEEVTARVPQVKIENGTISYEHSKDALTVHVGDVVIYTLRIYNEGEISGYASEITDDIPEYLEYLPEDSTNVEYMWKMYDENGNETGNVEEAVKVKTEYLSKENGEDNLINAFDGTTLSYKDIKIAFKVKDPNSNTYIITNYAQISDDTDENGNTINDKDSKTDEWNEGEDDQDIENVRVEYFDLALLKFVSKVIVIEDGKETITETGYNGYEDPEPVVKVELHKKKLNNVVVKFGYGITIINEGDIAGYATEITDYVPEGLKFDATDNPEWTDEGNNVISTKQLEGVLLQPGESATVEVIFTWINGADNLALKTNTAEISEDKNEYDVPDKDSTPDNKKDGEDDIDIAKVILAIKTGAAQTYFTLTLGLLAVIAIGVALIKRFVI